MILAAAQTSPQEKTIEENLREHYHWIEKAANKNVDLLLFPEMSITGYQRENASKLAFEADDQRLGILSNLASEHNMTIFAGAPVRLQENLYIGSFIIKPTGKIDLYTKQFLHEGEEKYFQSSIENNHAIEIGKEKISLAICADIENPDHPKNALESGSTIYAASIFYSAKGIDAAHNRLSEYAKNNKMCVLMANFPGQHWGIQSGGKSAFWDDQGNLIAELNPSQSGILIVSKNELDFQSEIILSKNN